MVSFHAMRPRSRSPFALIALLTLLVSTTETLWASVCAPEMQAVADAAAAPAAPAHAPGCAGEAADTAPASGHRNSAPDTPHCPLLALGSGGACVPASLPSGSGAQACMAHGREVLPPRMHAEPDPLFATPPFHPPKA